jgi:hypothetical protein
MPRWVRNCLDEKEYCLRRRGIGSIGHLFVVANSPYQVLEHAVAVQVGSDTYLFWDNYGHGRGRAVGLANVSVWSVQWDSF